MRDNLGALHAIPHEVIRDHIDGELRVTERVRAAFNRHERERRASVISAQQSATLPITLRNLASAQCFSKMLSKLGYESCFSVVV